MALCSSLQKWPEGCLLHSASWDGKQTKELMGTPAKRAHIPCLVCGTCVCSQMPAASFTVLSVNNQLWRLNLKCSKRRWRRWSRLAEFGQGLVNTPSRRKDAHYSCSDNASDLGFLLSGTSDLQSWIRSASWTLGPEVAALFRFQVFPGPLDHRRPWLVCLGCSGNNTGKTLGMFSQVSSLPSAPGITCLLERYFNFQLVKIKVSSSLACMEKL